ncbi:Eukaryotic initiation factor 4A-II [Dissophora globulifera]|nr:Eukaryotic initiation factor 4A-II [Dissophora globulifera]
MSESTLETKIAPSAAPANARSVHPPLARQSASAESSRIEDAKHAGAPNSSASTNTAMTFAASSSAASNTNTTSTNGSSNNNISSHTPPASTSTRTVQSSSPSPSSVNSPKSSKSKRNSHITSSSPSSRGSGGGNGGGKPGSGDSAPLTATDTVGLGVVHPGSSASGPVKSASDSNSNSTSSPQPLAAGPGPGSIAGRKSGPTKSSGERWTNPAPLSRGSRGSSGAGGDDEGSRGRTSDRKPADRVEAGHSSTTATESSTTEASVPSAKEYANDAATKESPGISGIKKAQQAIQSPRSPRSPRRGFGGDKSAEFRLTAGAQDAGSSSSPATVVETVAASSPRPEKALTSSADQATPPKKRKAPKKNRKRDDDELSTTSANSSRNVETTTTTIAAVDGNGGDSVEQEVGKQDKSDIAETSVVRNSVVPNRENTAKEIEGSQSPFKSRASRGPRQDHFRDSPSATGSGANSDTASRAGLPFSSGNLRNKREDSSSSYGAKGSQQNLRNGGREPRRLQQQQQQQQQQQSAQDPRETKQRDGLKRDSSAAEAQSTSGAVDKDLNIPEPEGWGAELVPGKEDSRGNSSTSVSSPAKDDGWGESSNSGLKWGEDVPWEQRNPSWPLSTPKWGNDTQQSTEGNIEAAAGEGRGARQQRYPEGVHGRPDSGRGRGRGRPMSSGDVRFSGPQQGHQRGGPGGLGGSSRRLQDRESDPYRDARSPMDARSSLDTRNARLGLQRGPHTGPIGELGRNFSDGKGTAIKSSTPTPTPAQYDAPAEHTRSRDLRDMRDSSSKRSSTGSADVRLDPQFNLRQNGARAGQRSGPFSQQYGENNNSSSSVASDHHQRGAPAPKDKLEQPGQVRQSPKPKEPREPREPRSLSTFPPPLFSNSLQCQVAWDEMGLRSNVIAKINEAGLKKPSNIQKLVMQPFQEGKDVIAQSQSQNDRTITLAIALLQKLSPTAATQKHCQALVICSEGINPQKVHEDFQSWFEAAPGMRSLLLTSDTQAVLSDPEQAKQVVLTTLGPLMEALRNNTLDMKTIGTVVISMRAAELVNFDAFKQFWALLSREAQVVLMTGQIQPQIQLIKAHHFRADTAVRRADELTMQWSEHYYISIPPSQKKAVNIDGSNEGGDGGKDHKWDVLMQILTKNPAISHTVVLTQSQSLTQGLTSKLEAQKLPVLSVWSMADKTEVARQFNAPDPCILVSESILMDNLDLDYSSLVINYEMPKRAGHYISSFGPFGRSGLRTLMINFCAADDPVQKQMLADMELLYDIKIQEMQVKI